MLIGGFLAVFGAVAPAGAATESFALSSATLPGQSSVGWQVGLGNPPATPNTWSDPITLNGQIDPDSGAISGATLSMPPVTQPPTEGETPTFTFSEVNPGTATGTYDSATGAVTLQDSLTLTFHITGIISNTCVSTPINVAFSGTWDSTTQDVTLATTSSFTIPQFPATANCAPVVAAGVNASPGGVAGSVGNAMSLALHGQFKAGLPTTTALQVSPDGPVLSGTAVTLSATVTDPSSQGTPTGTVTFLDNGTSVGTGTLDGTGAATLTTSDLPTGAQKLSATYAGDVNYAASASGTTAYTITPLPSVNATLPPSLTVPTSSSPPTITSLGPDAGPASGGTNVTITGTNFVPGTTVTFGRNKATDVTVANPTSITATAPAGSGTVDVTVTTPNGTSATSVNDLFSYEKPTVTAVSPNAVKASGNSTVTITGTGFVSGATVNVGSAFANSATVSSATSITASISGTSGTGTVDVIVTTPNGTSATSPDDQLTYGGTLVTRVSPTAGPTAGGTSVTITGSGFTGATAVKFGSTAATNITVKSDTSITATSPAGTGTVDVTVTSPSGTSSAYSADQFTYYAGAPTITGVSPNGGPAAGGTPVTITGTNFVPGATVKFGTKAATAVTVASPTEITAKSSTNGTGTVDVTVTTAGGTSATSAADQFTYGPTVTGVNPPSGPTAGGTIVTISGTNFAGATGVSFGSTAATSFTVTSATAITATSPAGSAGAVDVTVTTAGGASPTSTADQFFYGPPETNNQVYLVPNAGPATGGTTVVISGTGFLGATAVKFGSANATSFTVNSSVQITAVTPAGSGAAYVTVTTNGGTSSVNVANRFTYSNAPSVTAISPNSSTGPSTTVTITGANFTGASSVTFGSTPATSYTVNSATQITATAPDGSGTVDVVISSADGTSAIWPGDQFAYSAPTVTSVSPNSGPQAGGTGVVIRGTGFATGATVEFKNAQSLATSVRVISPTEITALSPPGSAGSVDVRVVTLGGTSAAAAGDQFTYSSQASAPAQFDVTVTNPSAGQSWDNVYAAIVLAGTAVVNQSVSDVTLSYQDSSGDWCPLTAVVAGSRASTTFTYSLSGVGSSCGSAPSSMSLPPGGSITIPMQLAYTSTNNLGPQSVTTTLYSGTCTSPTSCTQSGSLNGNVTSAGSIELVPVARFDTTVSEQGGSARAATLPVRQGFDVSLQEQVTSSAGSVGATTALKPTGTTSYLIDGQPVDVTDVNGQTVSSLPFNTSGVQGRTTAYYDTAGLAVGDHTVTTQYSGDEIFAPSSLTESFTVLPSPAGTPYVCAASGLGLSGTFMAYVTATSVTPQPALPGTNVWLTNVAVTLDADPNIGNIGQAPAVTFALSPGGSASGGTAPKFSIGGAVSDEIGTWSEMSAFVPVTGDPGSNVPVSLTSPFSFSYGVASTAACGPVSAGAPVAIIPVAGSTLSVSPGGSAAPGAPVTLTDAVYPPPPSGTAAGQYGQVDFYDGATDLGTVAVDTSGDAGNGTAAFITNALTLGSHQLTAVWSGGGGVPANTSAVVDYQVGSTSTTTLVSSANPANAANPVTFTATVNGAQGSPQPTGDVSFTEDGAPITSCANQPLSTANPPTATCKLTLPAGETHSIVATYSGDATYLGSSSDPLSQSTLPGTITSIISTKDPSPPGKVTFWAGVSPASGSGATPTGNVGFTIDGKGYSPCGAVPLGPGGGASCTVSFKAGTTHKVFATFAGSDTYSGSKSTTITQTVTGSSGSTKPKTSAGNATLASGKTLTTGKSLTAASYRLTMQGDGNLVEYRSGKALWASHTAGHPGAGVVMQKDGNLVIYFHGKAIWASKTAGHASARLTLQGTDGNVVIYQGTTALWATGT